jgi:16S rRNA (cytidine1402-2'-O)-methyltransferase
MEVTKRQNLPGLYVIATPIGNLSDLSPRALCQLEQADTILCEDTRETRKLFSALKLKSPRLERFDAHTQPAQIEHRVQRLLNGESLALVSDAGTPAISDPGAKLVQCARQAGVPVIPIPGPSALTTFLSAAGFLETTFTFRGFFPKKNKDQEKELSVCQSAQVSRLFVWFESPKRIHKTLLFVASKFPLLQCVAAKELTKMHELFFSGTLAHVSAQVKNEIETEGEKGEWCFALLFDSQLPAQSETEWIQALEILLKILVSPSGNTPGIVSHAARQISQYFGISKKIVYEMALVLLEKKERQNIFSRG